MYMVLIAQIFNGKNQKTPIGYRILDTDSKQVKDVSVQNLIAVLSGGQHTIENVELQMGTPTGTNGSLDRFPKIDTNGSIIGKSPIVILEEIGNDKYRCANYAGQIVDIPEETVIGYSNANGIANGKIVTDSETKKQHLSSINGTYKQNISVRKINAGKNIQSKLYMLNVRDYELDDNEYIKLNNKKLQSLDVPEGTKGIQDNGFRESNLTSIKLPSTLVDLGKHSFVSCQNLEKIEIPEGIKIVPEFTFKDNKKLREVHLPNSLEKIERGAFIGCGKLAIITTGPNSPEIADGAVPSHVRIVKRGAAITDSGDINENVENSMTDKNQSDITFLAFIEGKQGESLVRLMDNRAKLRMPETRDVREEDAVELIEKGVKINNIKATGGSIVVTNGDPNDYPYLHSNRDFDNTDKKIIISNIENKGFKVSDYAGNVMKLSNNDVVKLAKDGRIVNGMLANINGSETIISYGEVYPYETLRQNKEERTPSAIDLGITTSRTGLKSSAKTVVENQIDSRDIFSVMTPGQRAVLKTYYTDYTVDMYNRMAKSIRLRLAPGKLEKLSQLKGNSEWVFAGVWDTGFTGASHCAMGHALRYAYYAIPKHIDEERRKQSKNGVYIDLDDLEDKIIFGEDCVADFFSVSPDDMKKLIAARTTMSDEIKLIADTITNNLQEEKLEELKMLYEIIGRLEKANQLENIFGRKLATNIRQFIDNDLVFPKTLVLEISGATRNNQQQLFTALYPQYQHVINDVYSNKTRTSFNAGLNLLLNVIADNRIEGVYAYNPLKDAKVNQRRDIGAYNKDTRDSRRLENNDIARFTLSNKQDLVGLADALEIVSFYREASNQLYDNIGDEIPKGEIYKAAIRYVEQVTNDRNISKFAEDSRLRLALLNIVLHENKEGRTEERGLAKFRVYGYGGKIRFDYLNCLYVFSRYYGYGKESSAENALTEIELVKTYGVPKLAGDLINFYTNEQADMLIREKEEAELRKQEEADRLERERQEAEKRERERKQLLEDRAKAEAEREEKKKLIPDVLDKDVALDSYLSPTDKVRILRDLMIKHKEFTDVNGDKGTIKTAVNIVNRDKSYRSLTERQKFRVDEEINTYKELESNNSPNEAVKTETQSNQKATKTDGGIPQNNTYQLADKPEIQRDIDRLISLSDSVEMAEILKTNKNVLKICYTINRSKKASDRQLKYVNMAIEKLDKEL